MGLFVVLLTDIAYIAWHSLWNPLSWRSHRSVVIDLVVWYTYTKAIETSKYPLPHKQGSIFIWFKVLYQNKYRPILRKWNTNLINAEEVTALGYPMDPSRGQSTQLKPWLICFFTVNSDPRIDISGAMVSIYSFSTWQSIVSASFIHID